MKLHTLTSFACSLILIQGCNAGPDTPRPINQQNTNTISNTTAGNAKNQHYEQLLQALNSRDANNEAQQAITAGTPNVIGYYSGRAGLKVPGFSTEQQAQQRCKLNILDGMGDVIYGESHLKYRIAMRKFAKTYNNNMLAECL